MLLFSVSTLLAATVLQAVSAPTHEPPIFPFQFQYLFTATINFTAPAIPPVPLPGGYTLSVQVIYGTIDGPAGSGEIYGGTAYPKYFNNQTVEHPHIIVYGKLDGAADEGYFQVHEDGVATNVTHSTRIYVTVSGERFKYINDGFVLANTIISEDGLSLMARCYLVTDAVPRV
ncbi:hypothetical protein H2198_007810 [Neophaeococcomyces mojaviensis]|uniref:Uncharacterized protein n=1 Tax=Neophaeococcomyces mojaviensis TaxID=3383035 RepID=A0ACC2ZZ60_9EURO|nr:hypothetical protein H2198_007810 [Knufia sp. JES_112]